MAANRRRRKSTKKSKGIQAQVNRLRAKVTKLDKVVFAKKYKARNEEASLAAKYG